jgi:hypothetical protein
MPLPCEIVPVTIPAERPGSGAINFGKNGVAGSRKWVVPWLAPDGSSYYKTFVQQLLGLTIAGPNGLPAVTYPDVFSSDYPWLYCQEADVEGEDCVGVGLDGRITYRRAVITAKYTPYEMSENLSLSAQALSMGEATFSYLGKTDSQGFTILTPPPEFLQGPAQNNFNPAGQDKQQFLNDVNGWNLSVGARIQNIGVSDKLFQKYSSGPVNQPLTKVIPLGEYSLERTQVLAPNFWKFIALLGTVNAFFFIGFPPWTLLFSGIEGRRTVLPNGTRCWTLSFKFHFNPNSWNMIFRPETGQWEPVAANGQSEAAYWSVFQLANGEFIPNKAKGPLHPWLYTPADFSPMLYFS